jgi:hypothetical protein
VKHISASLLITVQIFQIVITKRSDVFSFFPFLLIVCHILEPMSFKHSYSLSRLALKTLAQSGKNGGRGRCLTSVLYDLFVEGKFVLVLPLV